MVRVNKISFKILNKNNTDKVTFGGTINQYCFPINSMILFSDKFVMFLHYTYHNNVAIFLFTLFPPRNKHCQNS